jgi:hypothetical protein
VSFISGPFVSGPFATGPFVSGAFGNKYGGPALDLQFAGMTAATFDPRITFSRAGNATQYDSQGRNVWAPANMLLNSATLSTQTVSAGFSSGSPLTVSFTGTGSIALSGGGSGTLNGTGANDRVSLNFTASSGSVTLTVSGDVRLAQLERTGVDSPKAYVATTGSAEYRPRLDYNPATLAPRGLLVEESRTNSVLNSVNLAANTPLTQSGATLTVNFAVAPDGTTTASRLQLTGGGFYYFRAVSGVSGAYTGSLFVKLNAAGGLPVLRASDGSGGDVTVINASSEWQRVSVTRTHAGATVEFGIDTRGIVGGDNAAVDLLVWGAQYEAGAFSTSYIPTFGTAATRAADQMPAFLFPVGATESTIVIEMASSPTASEGGSFAGQVCLGRNVLGEEISIYMTNTPRYTTEIKVGAVTQATLLSASLTPGTPTKISFSGKTGEFRISQNGSAPTKVLSGNYPNNLNRISIGSFAARGSSVNCSGTQWIPRFRYWPRADFTDAQLQALST